MWFEREIRQQLEDLALVRPALLLTGARQAGKTSLLQRSFPEHEYVSLDLPADAEAAEHDGQRFLERFEGPVVIDEVQYAPALLRHIKSSVDGRRREMGRFVLTGSRKFSLMEGITESLAGRISLLDLHSLSLNELEAGYDECAEGRTFWQWLFTGGYPELHAQGFDPARFFSDYVATYLQRDVRQALSVRSLRDFDRFMRLTALRTGQMLNVQSLATEVGVAATTIKSWLSVLEASNVVMLLAPYFRNAGKRLVKTPKLYFLDTGLCCFLAGLRHAEDLATSSLRGALFETQVVGQVVRRMQASGTLRDLYYYRDHGGTEVDLVIPKGEKLSLIECKAAEDAPGSVKAFDRLAELYGEENIVSRAVVTPRRGSHRSAEGILRADCVDCQFIEA